jgi:hypothetical protein
VLEADPIPQSSARMLPLYSRMGWATLRIYGMCGHGVHVSHPAWQIFHPPTSYRQFDLCDCGAGSFENKSVVDSESVGDNKKL